MARLIVHPVPVTQHPNKYVITQFVRNELFIYFKYVDGEFTCKSLKQQKTGLFYVDKLLAIKHSKNTTLHLYPNEIEHHFSGYYYEYLNSDWLAKVTADKSIVDDKDSYRHFIFDNHKHWIEVIAMTVKFKKVADNRFLEHLWDTVS